MERLNFNTYVKNVIVLIAYLQAGYTKIIDLEQAGKKIDVEVEGEEFHCSTDLYNYITEIPVSVEVRTDWVYAGFYGNQHPVDYKIVMTTGGPHIEIYGRLNHTVEPENVNMFYRDGSDSFNVTLTKEEEKTLLWFVKLFQYQC